MAAVLLSPQLGTIPPSSRSGGTATGGILLQDPLGEKHGQGRSSTLAGAQ